MPGEATQACIMESCSYLVELSNKFEVKDKLWVPSSPSEETSLRDLNRDREIVHTLSYSRMGVTFGG